MKSVQLPLDHLAELWLDDWRDARVGALLHPASVSSTLQYATQILEELNGQVLRLAAFFGPQHGFLGQTQDNMIGRYGFAKAPLGWHGQELIPRRNPFLRQHNKLIIKSETAKSETRSQEWHVTDTGPAVGRPQVGLYWGEDEPRGAVGRQPARPAGTWMEYAFEPRVTISR